MEDILISLYENKESKRCNFVDLRKIIESLFKSMVYLDILPKELKNSNGEINITACARLLAGMKCTNNGYEYTVVEKVLDKIASCNLYNILNVCHGYAHTESASNNRNRKETNKYLDITQTNNLLHSCALMLSDIILMYFHYIHNFGQSTKKPIFWEKIKCV